METDVKQRNPPQGLDPLARLGWQIRVNKYKPTARETEALQKCVEDARWYYLNGALLSGAVTWNLTGLGRKLRIFPRIFVTGVAAWIGRDLGGRFAGYSCVRTILSLGGSPMRGELIAIMREDFPNHPLLQSDLGQIEGLQPHSVGEPEEYAQEAHAPVPAKDWAVEMDDSSSRSRDWRDTLGHAGGYGQERINRIPRIWESSDKKEVKKDFVQGDMLADPFDMVMGTQVEVEADLNDNGRMEEVQSERRRSRMSAKERREYDRRKYEQRQEDRSY